MSKDKKVVAQTQRNDKKTYIFDIEVIGQDHTYALNVWNTLSHGDTAMCQIWYAYVNGHKSGQSSRS